MLFLILNILLLQSADALTSEEQLQNVLALYHTQDVETLKSGYSLDLTPVVPLRLVESDTPLEPQFSEPATTIRRSGLALTTSAPAGPPSLTYATFHAPLRIGAPSRRAMESLTPTGTTVTFSSQGDAALQALTGKGLTDFQIVAATICRWTPGSPFSFGLVTQLANSIGIQTISKETGSAIVQRRVDLNWHNLWPFVLKEGSLTALSIMTSGVWRPGRTAVFLTTLGHESGDHLPALFGRGAPNPDPYLRGSSASSDRIDLAPGECREAQFSGVYGGPKTSFVTDRLQLLP